MGGDGLTQGLVAYDICDPYLESGLVRICSHWASRVKPERKEVANKNKDILMVLNISRSVFGERSRFVVWFRFAKPAICC